MNELEAKCYLTKLGGANNSDHELYVTYCSATKVTIKDKDKAGQALTRGV